tara:strand:- start:497 stop:934 length:438 start_codon:yes stop_codon:yes gene_type:complete
MKKIYNTWKEFLKEDDTKVIKSLKNVMDIVKSNPNQTKNLDYPRGSIKRFGGKREFHLPFDYGEYVDLINPADNMGWDFVIVPSSSNTDNLLPVGYVKYANDQGKKIGNDKIIIAPKGEYSKQDVEKLETFFASVGFFDPIVWTK